MDRLTITTDLAFLRNFNVNITDVDRAQRICNLLWQEVISSQEDTQPNIGLTATQVSISARVAVLRHLRPLTDDSESIDRLDFINPVLVSRSGPISPFVESCVSLPEIRQLVPRFSEVVYNCDKIVDGVFVPTIITGSMASGEREDILFCQALQHEYDHMEGIVISDYTPDSMDHRVQEVFQQLAVEQEELYKRYHTPIKREHPKVGRNDPCICGSGKKYKKCCINTMEEVKL